MTKIATWNVNSLRVRLPQVLEWLAAHQPDVLALQETKLPDEIFPVAELAAAGYSVLFNGQRTYNGVALLARGTGREFVDVVRDLPGSGDPQRRVLAASVGPLRVVNPHVLMLGDFNIAPEDRDVHDPARWAGSVLVSEPERGALRELLALGFSDVFRRFESATGFYSWWDYRQGGFRRDHGLRIDLILAAGALAGRCLGSTIDREPRRSERASDHTPVVAEFDI